MAERLNDPGRTATEGSPYDMYAHIAALSLKDSGISVKYATMARGKTARLHKIKDLILEAFGFSDLSE